MNKIKIEDPYGQEDGSNCWALSESDLLNFESYENNSVVRNYVNMFVNDLIEAYQEKNTHVSISISDLNLNSAKIECDKNGVFISMYESAKGNLITRKLNLK